MEFLSDNLQKFMEAARKRPGAFERQQPLPRLGAPDLRRRGPREALEAGRGRGRRLPDPPGLPGRGVREPVQPVRTAVAGLPAGRGRRPGRARRHRPLPRAQQRRQHAAALDHRDHPPHLRARVHAALQHLPRRADHRAARARLQLGPGHASARRGGGPGPAPRDGLRLGRPLVPGEEGRGPLGDGLRAFPRLRVPGPGRALRELVAAFQRPPVGAGGGGRRLPRAVPARLRARRLWPDRSRHAHRPRGQERDPHRRVREGRVRARGRARGGRARRRALASAAHPHDLVRLHPRLRSPLDRDRRGGRGPPGPGHRRGLGHARGHRHRHLHHPRAVRDRGAARGGEQKREEAAPAGEPS